MGSQFLCEQYNIMSVLVQYEVHILMSTSKSESITFIQRECKEAKNKQYIHCKKRFTSFPSPAGMSLTKLPLGRNNSVMTSLFPPRESLVVTNPAGDGKLAILFFTVQKQKENFTNKKFLTHLGIIFLHDLRQQEEVGTCIVQLCMCQFTLCAVQDSIKARLKIYPHSRMWILVISIDLGVKGYRILNCIKKIKIKIGKKPTVDRGTS